MDFQVYVPQRTRCPLLIPYRRSGFQTRWAHTPEGPCSGGVRSSAVDDQTNGIGQLLYDIRDHVATQQTSEGSAV